MQKNRTQEIDDCYYSFGSWFNRRNQFIEIHETCVANSSCYHSSLRQHKVSLSFKTYDFTNLKQQTSFASSAKLLGLKKEQEKAFE